MTTRLPFLRRLRQPWLPLLFAALLVTPSVPVPAQTADQEVLVETGNRLAALLRAGRSVLSANQDLINDPAKADKGLTPEVFMEQVLAAYEQTNGEPPLTEGLTDLQRQLTEAQLNAMRDVVADAQSLINMPDMGFKGFIPAVFARLVNEEFSLAVGDLAKVKVTAPTPLVRNRTARPDDWEAAVIETKFEVEGYEKGAAWSELIEAAGEPQFRMLIPEYYAQSCLSCHGAPAGEVDITGFPKEGGKEGDLGGAISITLFATE